MEYLSVQFTPNAHGSWTAHPYVKTTMPTAQGHPRTLRTAPEVVLPGLRGLDVGSVAGVLTTALQSLGTLPLCARCQDALGLDEGQP